jgi:hypothetical protein
MDHRDAEQAAEERSQRAVEPGRHADDLRAKEPVDDRTAGDPDEQADERVPDVPRQRDGQQRRYQRPRAGRDGFERHAPTFRDGIQKCARSNQSNKRNYVGERRTEHQEDEQNGEQLLTVHGSTSVASD